MNLLNNRRFSIMLAVAAGLLVLLAGPVALAQQPAQPADLVNQAKGQAALDNARQHMLAFRWTQAINAYEAALTYLPGNQEAIAGIQRAQQALQEASTLSGVSSDLRVRKQRAVAEFDAQMANAARMLDQEEFRAAENAVLTAQLRIREGRSLFSESEFADRMRRAQEMLSAIEIDREKKRLERQRTAEEEADRNRRVATDREKQERTRLVEQNLGRVRQLQSERKYEEALQVIDEIIFIDQHNQAAHLLRSAMETTILYVDYANVQRQKENSYAGITLDAQRNLIAPHRNVTGPGDKSLSAIMTYPEDWARLSIQRTSDLSMAEPAANRRVAQVLASAHLPIVDFQETPFDSVVAYIGEVTGENIYPDWKALDFIGVDRSEPVTLALANVPVGTVLDRVVEQLGDGYDRPQWSIQDGIVTISSEESLRKNTVSLVYDIRDLLFEVPYFGNAPELELAAAMGQTSATISNGVGGGSSFGSGGSFGGRSDSSGGSIFSEPSSSKPRMAREAIVGQIVSIIQDTIDPDGWRDMGGDVGSLQELNGNLIITNTLRNHRQIEGLLSQLREIRALQINVESRFLAVSTNWFEQIGVDLDLYFNTNNTLRQQQLAQDPLGHLSDFFDGSGQLKDPLIFGSINQTPDPNNPPFINTINFGNSIGIPVDTDGDGLPDSISYITGGAPPGGPIRNTQGFSPIGFVQDSLGLTGAIADLTGFGEMVAAANPALSLGIQFLDDVQVDLLIEATQADRRSIVMTAPRLSFFNGQRAWVAVATQKAFISSLIPIAGDGAAAFQPIPGVVSDGVVLDVEGVISADRRYVTMTVIVSVSKIVDIREFEVEGAVGGTGNFGGGGGGGAATFASKIELPEVEVALVQTTVSVPDKGSVLLGGQRLVSEIEVETGVPVLSKIPFINRFFTNRLTTKTEETLLILIRPEILIQQEHEDMLFPGLSDSLGGGAAGYLR